VPNRINVGSKTSSVSSRTRTSNAPNSNSV
jgi:hypothetical protein